MQQSKVFPATFSAKKGITRRAYLLFGGGAGMLACGLVAVAVSFATGNEPPPAVLAGGGVLACAGGAGLLLGMATLTQIRKPMQVEVTPHRLIWREGGKSATLEFDEVVRVELYQARKAVSEDFTMAYPIVRFIEDDGEMMEFDATFADRGFTHRSRFDTRAITAEVLNHIGVRAVVSPAVEEFVRDGEVDIDSLPVKGG